MAGHRVELGIAFLIGLSLYIAHVEAGARVNPESCGYSERKIDCTFNVTDADNMNTTCNTTLRQVFRLLSVTNSSVLLGSAGCLYVLDENLNYNKSAHIPINASDVGTCNYVVSDDNLQDFFCQNYINAGIEKNATSLFVCGTYDVANPRCYNCDITSENVTCNSDWMRGNGDNDERNLLPRNILRNHTVLFTEENEGNYVIFVGTARRYGTILTREDPVFARVNATNGISEVRSDPEVTWISTPKDFVGEPIEHGAFVYFFYRERAEENTITPTIYSRVARVCKNDTGGSTNPLEEEFTTFLKTRLICSSGQTFPSFYNEIQDVTKPEPNSSYIYAVFTTPTTGMVSSAICRYNFDELDNLFNNDDRRGVLDPGDSWQRITKDGDDTVNKRTCQDAYATGTYNYLLDYPLLNANAPNCGLNQPCDDYTRSSDDALVVLEGIVGQQLVVLDETENSFVAYVGTNNRSVYRVEIDTTEAIIAEKTVVARCVDLPDKDVRDKWPYGISGLFIRSNTVYGTMDHCAFKMTVESQDKTAAKLISSRSAPGNYTLRRNLPKNVSYIIITRLFEAPQGTDINATFSEMSSVTDTSQCSQKRFDLASCNTEILQVVCNVTNDLTSHVTGVIRVTSLCGRSQPYDDVINVDVDNSTVAQHCPDVNEYDNEIARYKYNYNEWLKNRVPSCDQDALSVCNGGPCCMEP